MINYKQVIDILNKRLNYISWYFSYETFYQDNSDVEIIYLNNDRYDHKYLVYTSGLLGYYIIETDEDLINHILHECEMIKMDINMVMDMIVNDTMKDVDRIVNSLNEINKIGGINYANTKKR